MNCWEPQRLPHRLERAEIAAGANNAIVECNLINGVGKDWLDGGDLPLAIEILDLAPDELHAHRTLQDRLKCEGQRIEVAGLDVGSQHAWRILEVLLRVDDGYMELA